MINDLELLEKFILARWFYAIGQPIFSDSEYTYMLNACKAQYPDSPYINRSWSSDPCPVELLKRIHREDAIQHIILSDKTESIESLNTEFDLQRTLGGWTGLGTLSYKHDGWNMQASYYNGELINVASRGRSSDSMNADALRNIIPNTIPVQGKVKVVMEATIPNHNFPLVVRKYNTKDQRASVSTILAHPEDIAFLECHAFDVHGYDALENSNKFELLLSWGFNVPGYYIIENYDDILTYMEILSNEKLVYDSPTDGIVFDGGFKYAIRLGAWAEPIYSSFVTGYDESYNKHVITPRLCIYPVLRGTTRQSRIAITNWERIINYNLQIGAPVAFRVASSANADINEEATKALQQEWENRWKEYQDRIKENESIKQYNFETQMYGVIPDLTLGMDNNDDF